MKLSEITKKLDELYPNKYCEQWDNVGLLVGDSSWDINKIAVALDATMENINKAIDLGVDLIITHHPRIFSGLKKINDSSLSAKAVVTLLSNKTACYAMHTNYDTVRMGFMVAELLGLTDIEPLEENELDSSIGIGAVGNLINPIEATELAKNCKKLFNLPYIRLYKNDSQKVKRIAICPGSGKSLIKQVFNKNADLYITGDIDHHTALDALDDGLAIIDGTHYGTEYFFVDDVCKSLERELKNIEIIKISGQLPFILV